MLMLDLPNTTEVLSPIGRSLPSGTTRHVIADGIKGTAQTIKMMQDLVNAGKRDNDIRALVGSILNPADGKRPVDSKDYYNYGRVLYEWVRDNILYAYDPHMVEYLEKPSIILKNRIGDCDSMDILLCSMFEQVGLQSQFVTIKADASRPDEYTHVYTRVMIPKMGWVVADPIMPGKWFGWEPPFPSGKRYWAATTDVLDQPLDTSESVPFLNPGQPMQMENPFGDVIGMSGFSGSRKPKNRAKRLSDWEGGLNGLGRDGHRGGHSHGRTWGGGDGFVAYGDNSLVPIGIPVPDQIIVVREVEVEPQQIESVFADDDNIGVQGGFSGFGDNVVSDFVSSAVASVTGIFQAAPTENDKWTITKVLDGTMAKDLADMRSKANAAVDSATKTLMAARASKKTTAINAATALRGKAYDYQYSVNDAVAKYNQLAGTIAALSFDKLGIPPYKPPTLSGMGELITAVTVGAVLAAVGTAGVVALYLAVNHATDSAHEFAKYELDTKVALQKAGVDPKGVGSSGSDCGFQNIGQCVKDFQTGVGVSLLNTGLVLGGLFIAYKFFNNFLIEGGRDYTRATAEGISRRISGV